LAPGLAEAAVDWSSITVTKIFGDHVEHRQVSRMLWEQNFAISMAAWQVVVWQSGAAEALISIGAREQVTRGGDVCHWCGGSDSCLPYRFEAVLNDLLEYPCSSIARERWIVCVGELLDLLRSISQGAVQCHYMKALQWKIEEIDQVFRRSDD